MKIPRAVMYKGARYVLADPANEVIDALQQVEAWSKTLKDKEGKKRTTSPEELAQIAKLLVVVDNYLIQETRKETSEQFYAKALKALTDAVKGNDSTGRVQLSDGKTMLRFPVEPSHGYGFDVYGTGDKGELTERFFQVYNRASGIDKAWKDINKFLSKQSIPPVKP